MTLPRGLLAPGMAQKAWLSFALPTPPSSSSAAFSNNHSMFTELEPDPGERQGCLRSQDGKEKL